MVKFAAYAFLNLSEDLYTT